MRTATRAFLDALRALVASIVDGADGRSRLRKFRDLTLAFQAVRDATRPNAGSWGRPAGTSVDFLEALWGCRYFAGRLALREDTDLVPPAAVSARRRIDRSIDRLCRRLSRGASPSTASTGPTFGPDAHDAREADLLGLEHALSALDAALKDPVGASQGDQGVVLNAPPAPSAARNAR